MVGVMDTFRTLIERWPSLSAFADDIGVIYVTAQGMHRRGSIPSEYWAAVVEGATKRGIAGVNLEILAAISAAKRGCKPADRAGAGAVDGSASSQEFADIASRYGVDPERTGGSAA